MRPTYTAIYERDTPTSWSVTLAEEPRVSAKGRTLAHARPRIRHAAELWFHLNEFDLVEQFRLPDDLNSHLDHALQQRAAALQAQQDAMTSTRDAARVLVGQGNLTFRDAADLLGMSHSRIQQLLND